MNVRIFQGAIDSLKDDPGVAEQLRKTAQKVKGRVRAPRRMRVFTRAGVGPRGAFAQVVMEDADDPPGAVAVEFGTKDTPPLAPLRKALGGSR